MPLRFVHHLERPDHDGMHETEVVLLGKQSHEARVLAWMLERS